MHAFFDKSVLEVFVNKSTLITTRICYPLARCYGIHFFAEPAKGQSGQTSITGAGLMFGMGLMRTSI